ncbi:phosphatidate cytidylyltransferase [Rubrivirga sp. IMCC43871]|uniref:phosphatidate cytidylyltransferase n=1 Tax=Rubrivirga sp. IMCC43871 TaxID=3391575 RepID=UPI0039902928
MTRFFQDPDLQAVLVGVLGLLAIASVAVAILRRRVTTEAGRVVVDNLALRVKAWWAMVAVLALTLATGGVGSVLLFGATSFLALREFATLSPATASDHSALTWAFFVVIPVQYLFVWLGLYGMVVLFIPVYVFLFAPVRSAATGDTTDFLGRAAAIHWGLMVCVYCVSYAPLLLSLATPGFEGETIKLLIFLIVVVQLSDVLQYVVGKTVGRRPLAPRVSPNKTWEGLIGGVLGATAIGAGLWWMTPFSPLAASAVSLVIAVAGASGGLVMSAVKRDRGAKDFGALIPGHGGVLDRIDSVCFAAPVFFHVTRFFYVTRPDALPAFLAGG